MSITFRPAIREKTSTLIGFIGPSGSGKTWSALELATGIVKKSGGKIAFIDTESGRALHYATYFAFDHAELRAPFRPEAYIEAIKAAESAGYDVIIVDSMSHVWAGEGGVIDWQEDELTRMAGDDYRKREACKMAAWIKPKMSHKAMVQSLLQVKAHLIMCFRAEEKTEISKDSNGKTQITSKGFLPVCEKNLPYELTISMLFNSDAPGIPKPLKLQEQHKFIFAPGEAISARCGELLALWSSGGDAAKTSAKAPRTRESMIEAVKVRIEGNKALADQLDAYCREKLGLANGLRGAKQDEAALAKLVDHLEKL